MSIQFGTIATAATVSSAFTLSATDRVLLVAVNSHNQNLWFCAFQLAAGGPFYRYQDPWSSVQSQAFFGGAQGGVGLVAYAPSTTVRIEVGSSMTATTSFTILEVVR